MQQLNDWSWDAERDPRWQRHRPRHQAACLQPIWWRIGYKDEYPGVCLYMGQAVRILCDEDRKDE
jgi:hypothetical protein